MFINNKVIIYHENIFLLSKKIKEYEPIFINKLDQKINFVFAKKHLFFDRYKYYFGIKTNNPLHAFLFKGGICWCNVDIFKTHDDPKLKYQMMYMNTAYGFRKKGVQQLLQAVICDIFQIQELTFITTYKLGEKYIQQNDIFSVKNVISQIKYPDIICQVDLAKCRELIEKYL